MRSKRSGDQERRGKWSGKTGKKGDRKKEEKNKDDGRGKREK